MLLPARTNPAAYRDSSNFTRATGRARYRSIVPFSCILGTKWAVAKIARNVHRK